MLIRYDNVMIMRCREANGMILVLVLCSLSVFYIFPFNSYFKQIYDDDDEWNGSISHQSQLVDHKQFSSANKKEKVTKGEIG